VRPELARLVPKDAHILAGVDVARLQASTFWVTHPKLNSVMQGWDSFAAANPQIEAVIAAWVNGAPTVILDERLPSGKTVVKYATGQPSKVVTGISEPIASELEHLPKEDQIWVVSSDGLPLPEMPKRMDVASALSNVIGYVSASRAGVFVDSGLHLRAVLECPSSAAGRRVRDAFLGGLALARVTAKDQATRRLCQAIQVAQDGNDVTLKADLPPELSEGLLKYAPQIMK
jgi:hypothetical protein